MAIANVSFAIIAILPLGWALMALALVLETAVLSRVLAERRWSWAMAGWVFLINAASAAVGIQLSIALDGGWWLVLWVPWVSWGEAIGDGRLGLLALYVLVAFGLSLGIEGLLLTGGRALGWLRGRVWRAALLANLLSTLCLVVALALAEAFLLGRDWAEPLFDAPSWWFFW